MPIASPQHTNEDTSLHMQMFIICIHRVVILTDYCSDFQDEAVNTQKNLQYGQA